MTKRSQKVVPTKKQGLPLWLPLIIMAGVALIVVALVSGNAAAPAAQPTLEVKGAPALKVDKDNVDFGNVTLGRTVEVKFEVLNVGDKPLSFKEKPYVEVVEGC